MKELGYRLFAILCRVFSVLGLKDNKVFLIMTHDAGPTGNVAVMRDYMKANGDYIFCELKRSDTHFGGSLKRIFKFFFYYSYHLARSRYVLMDNMFLPYAYIKPHRDAVIVQLWHGTGVIKKIGADTNKGRLKELEKMANLRTTHLIVSSDTTKRIYSGSFSIPPERVFVTGMPRVDYFFSSDEKPDLFRTQFYKEYPKLADKKIILYAPTFRDKEAAHPRLLMDVKKLADSLPEDTVLAIRLHPFVANAFHKEHRDGLGANVVDMSTYKSLNTLLVVSDMLISDYSSIVFEYSILKKPMVFFVPDIEEFSDSGRGFYHDYESYVPGPVVKQEEELLDNIRRVSNIDIDEYDALYHLNAFIDDTYAYRDDNNAKRVYELMMGGH